MEPVPFLWYNKAELEGIYEYHLLQPTEFHRAQLMVQFTDSRGNVHILVARFILDYFRDFCGGLILRSPQVITRSKNSWNAHESFWAQGIPCDGMFTWPALERGDIPVPSLNTLLNSPAITAREAKEWAFKQMALSVGTYTFYSGRRLVHCNGNVDGKMHRLVCTMQELGTDARCLAYLSGVQGHIGGEHHNACVPRLTADCIFFPGMEVYETEEFTNPNSGHDCVGWNIIFDNVRENTDITCSRCGWYNRATATPFPCEHCGEIVPARQRAAAPVDTAVLTQFLTAYNDLTYTRTLTRPLWRNG